MKEISLQQRGGKLEIKFNHVAKESINHVCHKTPIKSLDTKAQWSFPVEHMMRWEVMHTLTPQAEDRKLCLWDPPPCPICLLIWLVLMCILYNKNISISISLF